MSKTYQDKSFSIEDEDTPGPWPSGPHCLHWNPFKAFDDCSTFEVPSTQYTPNTAPTASHIASFLTAAALIVSLIYHGLVCINGYCANITRLMNEVQFS